MMSLVPSYSMSRDDPPAQTKGVCREMLRTPYLLKDTWYETIIFFICSSGEGHLGLFLGFSY